ncbi:MAG: hypothetical protein V1779_07520 [bacterium]
MKKILIIGMVFLCFACSTTQKINIDKIKTNFKPEINLLVDSNVLIFNFTLIIKTDSTDDEYPLDIIKSLKVDILDDNKQVIDSSSINSLKISGKPIKGYNIIYSGKVVFNNFKRKDFEKLSCKYTVKGDGWDITVTQKFNEMIYAETEPALVIYPIIDNMDKISVDLGIFAVRKRIIEEYIPTSEDVRVEVLNSKNKPAYNSQTGKNYMQVINPVYPESLGDSYVYRYSWDYRNNHGQRVPSGDYTIRLIIPAKPKPYITEIKIPVEAK